ncbi:MAG: hypothetical protein HOJ19_00015 [Candidatus Marinimicrobia bacterium]|nr:hypothetical protein [Candidatus Neomarinimicrobiota bacterium]MBT7089927.1 hypothetical protein [Candidatus Neomarinimicrobiota bacterium]
MPGVERGMSQEIKGCCSVDSQNEGKDLPLFHSSDSDKGSQNCTLHLSAHRFLLKQRGYPLQNHDALLSPPLVGTLVLPEPDGCGARPAVWRY